jgi:hypothetical protein
VTLNCSAIVEEHHSDAVVRIIRATTPPHAGAPRLRTITWLWSITLQRLSEERTDFTLAHAVANLQEPNVRKPTRVNRISASRYDMKQRSCHALEAKELLCSIEVHDHEKNRDCGTQDENTALHDRVHDRLPK